jgi:hypothetical protein
MTEQRDMAGTALRYGPLGLCGAVLLWHSLQYNFVTDDAFISFVYSRNFAEHNSLVFNLGDPVEGYTNFLWTFILGLLMKLGLPPEVTSRLLGTGFAMATLYVSFRLVEWIGRPTGSSADNGSWWDYLAPALLAMSAGFACWSSGGLETQMFTFFIALALYAYTRAEPRWMRVVGGALALAAMTRPEGLMIAGLLAIHRVALNGIRDRRFIPNNEELGCITVFLLLWAPYFVWRWWYYGHPFPNTYYVKAAGEIDPSVKDYDARVISNGLHYLWQWLLQSKLIFVSPIALAGLVVARPRTPRFVFGSAATLVTAIYLYYTVTVGGDFMGLHRFIMPLFFIAAVGVVLGLRLGASLIRPAPSCWFVIAIAALYGVSQYRLTVESLRWGNFKNDNGIDTPAFLAVYTHDRAAVGKHMKHCFRDGDFADFGGVGAQPYYAEVDGLDLFGLVSWDVAHCQPRKNPRAGHNKWASNQLLAKQPRRDGHFCPPRGKSSWSQVDGGPPDFWFARYGMHPNPKPAGGWQGTQRPSKRDYDQVTLHIGCTDEIHSRHADGWKPASPEMKQHGKYYTFYVHKERMKSFKCRGLVK